MAGPENNTPPIPLEYNFYVERKASGDKLSALCNKLAIAESTYPRDINVRTPERARIAATRINIIHPFKDSEALDYLGLKHTKSSLTNLLAKEVPSLLEPKTVRLVGLRDPFKTKTNTGCTVFNLMLQKTDAAEIAQEQKEALAVIESEIGYDQQISSLSPITQVSFDLDIRILWAGSNVDRRHVKALRKITEAAFKGKEEFQANLAPAIVVPSQTNLALQP